MFTELGSETTGLPFLIDSTLPVSWGEVTESPQLTIEKAEIEARMRRCMSGMGYPTLRPVDAKQYGKLQDRADAIATVKGALLHHYFEASSVFNQIIIDALKTGIEINERENALKRLEILERNGLSSSPTAEAIRFIDFKDTVVGIKIGDVCLADFARINPRKPFSVGHYFDYLLKAAVLGRRRSYQEVLKDNEVGFMADYPRIAEVRIHEMAVQAINTIQAPVDNVERFVSKKIRIFTDVSENAKAVIEGANAVGQSAFSILTNPDSEQFLDMSTRIGVCLLGERDERIYTLFLLGLTNLDSLREMYRVAEKNKNGKEGEFYSLMLASLDDLIEEYPTAENLPSYDEVSFVINEDETIEDRVPELTEFGQIIGSTFSKTNQRDFNFDPEEINWGALVKPQSVEIRFGNRPKQFLIRLLYENEIGEKLNFETSYDTEKQTMDWTFLQSPDDLRLLSVKKALLLGTKTILLKVQDRVIADLEEKGRLKLARTQSLPAAPIRPSKAPYVPTPKEVKESENPQVVMTPIMRALQELQQPAEVGIKNHINLPDEKKLNELLEEIAEYDRSKVITDLTAYNESNVGQGIKPLVTDGEQVFERKIGSKGAHKGIRVLVTIATSSDGHRNFDIYRIWYRGNAFKRHRRKQLNEL
jgi:hypothetical protein